MEFKTKEGMNITDKELPQTADNVRLVRQRAGFTVLECGYACGINPVDIVDAEIYLSTPLDEIDWETMKRICNKRLFDHKSTVEV